MTRFRRKANRVVVKTRQQTWVFERPGKPIPDRDVRAFKSLAQMSKSGRQGEVDINLNLNDKGEIDPRYGNRKISLRYEDVISVDFE